MGKLKMASTYKIYKCERRPAENYPFQNSQSTWSYRNEDKPNVLPSWTAHSTIHEWVMRLLINGNDAGKSWHDWEYDVEKKMQRHRNRGLCGWDDAQNINIVWWLHVQGHKQKEKCQHIMAEVRRIPVIKKLSNLWR